MPSPIVIAYHPVWTAYGWWLPNDPRGSGSRTIASDVIAQLGELHHGRKRVQPAGRTVREFYKEAATVLLYPLLPLDAEERPIVADGFARAIALHRYTCYACAVMPDHVHVLIRKHRHQAEEIAGNLMEHSRAALVASAHRTTDHPVWSGGNGWSVFLEHPDDVRRTIPYIERNPQGMGLPVQRWSFVTPYDGWPLHAGHSPNSPYARWLRAVGRYP